jgi:hypothetical protein
MWLESLPCPVGSADWTYFWFWGYTYQVVENLVADDARHLEALLAGDRVDNDVAVDADEVLRVEDAVLILRAPVLLATSSQQAWAWLFGRAAPCAGCVGAAWCGWGWRPRRDAGRKEILKVPDRPCL